MWVIEDFRDAPMMPIALFPDERLARAFAASACGDNAHVYQVTMSDVLESCLDMRAADDDESEDDDELDAPVAMLRGDLNGMLYRMRERPAPHLAAVRSRAAGAR